MLAEYLGVLIILAIALSLAVGLLVVPGVFGLRRVVREKQEPCEDGEQQIESPRQRFPVKFSLVAILFIVFDVGAVFFYPWGANFRELGVPGLIAIGLFTVPLLVGLTYQWAKGALEW